jgi:hypothetical protein
MFITGPDAIQQEGLVQWRGVDRLQTPNHPWYSRYAKASIISFHVPDAILQRQSRSLEGSSYTTHEESHE